MGQLDTAGRAVGPTGATRARRPTPQLRAPLWRETAGSSRPWWLVLRRTSTAGGRTSREPSPTTGSPSCGTRGSGRRRRRDGRRGRRGPTTVRAVWDPRPAAVRPWFNSGRRARDSTRRRGLPPAERDGHAVPHGAVIADRVDLVCRPPTSPTQSRTRAYAPLPAGRSAHAHRPRRLARCRRRLAGRCRLRPGPARHSRRGATSPTDGRDHYVRIDAGRCPAPFRHGRVALQGDRAHVRDAQRTPLRRGPPALLHRGPPAARSCSA